jgi:pimeloyl-ACP methyl ester carboxylesterase
MSDASVLPDLPLPAGIRSRFVDGVDGLRVHLLEAGEPGRPALLLLHGFPELAWSWRKLMPPLAAAGWHVIAPDQRGYGRSSGFDTAYDADLRPYGLRNLARDAVALLDALGIGRAAAVVGHDFGSLVAGWCALLYPERFASVALMSAPFGGPPAAATGGADIHAALAALPRPRKHYQHHYSTREANDEMWHCPQGVHDFLRAYYHMKSADWPGNLPHELQGWRADELARMPEYYVMALHQGMAQTVAPHRPTRAEAEACAWLTEAELAVYAAEFGRTGFQGGLNWYRCSTHPPCGAELQAHAGRTIDVPACFIAGAADWGMFQKPGDLQRMRGLCTQWRGAHVVPGAGHWVQQEQPEAVRRLLQDFLAGAS